MSYSRAVLTATSRMSLISCRCMWHTNKTATSACSTTLLCSSALTLLCSSGSMHVMGRIRNHGEMKAALAYISETALPWAKMVTNIYVYTWMDVHMIITYSLQCSLCIVYICIYVTMYARTHVYTYVYICMYRCIYIYAYIYIAFFRSSC